MADVTYPPLDVLKPVADNVWIVDSGPMRPLGLPIPIRMTVIRLADGSVLLVSPTPFDFELRAEIDKIGPIGHLLAPNTVHWSFMKPWQSHCPEAKCWTAPGLGRRPAVARSGLRIDGEVRDTPPAAWGGDIATVVLPGAGFAEVELFHRPSRTLVLTDLVVNMETSKLPAMMALGARLVGSAAPHGKAPVYARMVINARRESASKGAAQLLAFEPERVIFAHGEWFESDGAARLRKSLDWLLPAA